LIVLIVFLPIFASPTEKFNFCSPNRKIFHLPMVCSHPSKY